MKNRDYWLLTALAFSISAASLVFYLRHGAILLYGDAVAHTSIARHILDSRTPGILEFGTVWLPLPHLIQMPFVMNGLLWRSGLGASIPSMIAFVIGAWGIFRLLRSRATRAAAWIAALIYVLNPNLIYMQATAMTESLYLALFVWAIVHFSEFTQSAATGPRSARKSLESSGIMISAAILVRYDGWFLAACAGVALVAFLGRLKWRSLLDPAILRGTINFVLVTVLSAVVWLVYNHDAYGNALEFANGPYSARAIAAQTRSASFPAYPGENSLRTAALYYMKVSKLNLGEGPLEAWLPGVAFATLLAAFYFSRRHWPLMLLWTPAAFYVLTIAYGSVPVYFPQWWPFSYYNVRYGLQLLPAIAVFVALGYEFLSRLIPTRFAAVAVTLLLAASYLSVWHNQPVCLREAEANGAARLAFDGRLAAELKKLPEAATLMMYCGAHSGALQAAGIPFRRVLREGNHPDWEIALSGPAKAAGYVVAITGDDVFRAVHTFPENLQLVTAIDNSGGEKAFIYRSVR